MLLVWMIALLTVQSFASAAGIAMRGGKSSQPLWSSHTVLTVHPGPRISAADCAAASLPYILAAPSECSAMSTSSGVSPTRQTANSSIIVEPWFRGSDLAMRMADMLLNSARMQTVHRDQDARDRKTHREKISDACDGHCRITSAAVRAIGHSLNSGGFAIFASHEGKLLRRSDLNRRPAGYEPTALPAAPRRTAFVAQQHPPRNRSAALPDYCEPSATGRTNPKGTRLWV
jgi:hypothetical protein